MKTKRPKRKRKPRGIDDRLGKQHMHAPPHRTKLDPIPGKVHRQAVARFNESKRRRQIIRKFRDEKGRPGWRVVREIYKHAAQ